MGQPNKNLIGLFLTAFWVALLFFTGVTFADQGPKMQPQGLNQAGIYALRQIDPSLTGAGVRFAVICRSITYIDGEPQNDYRPNINHNCFKAVNFDFYNQTELPVGISPHSTAICSILFGEDTNAFNPQLGNFYYQGAAPKAEADIYEFWHFLINNVLPQSPPDVDILTVGVGSQVDDWWTRGIESLAEHYGLIFVAGIGNGLNANDPVLYPGAAANVIGVGVVSSVYTEDLARNLEHFSLVYPEQSSFGPTSDLRCKPDLVAPGNCMAANANDPNRYEPTGNWSSFSTPTVAGAVGLLVQKAKQDEELSSAVSKEGGNCVIKSILMNSAEKLPFWHKGRLSLEDDHTVALDYIQGAGMLNAVCAYNHLIAGQHKPGNVPDMGWDLNKLDKSQKIENYYRINLEEPSDKVITVTAVWNKHYSRFYPFEPMPDKDIDLRLELWAVDFIDPNKDYLLDYSNSEIDNVEHIYINADSNYINYEIVISINNIGSQQEQEIDASQNYAIAWSVSDKQDDDSIFWYDLNADGIVNISDSIILLNNMVYSNQSNQSYILGDINTDGAIDVSDVKILIEHLNLQADW